MTCWLSTMYVYTAPVNCDGLVAVARTVSVAELPEATLAVSVVGLKVRAGAGASPPPPPPHAASTRGMTHAHAAVFNGLIVVPRAPVRRFCPLPLPHGPDSGTH